MRERVATSLVSILMMAACGTVGGHTCPRGGLETARNCRRDCVQSLGRREPPLPCECRPECGCWRFPGHPVRAADGGEQRYE